MSAEYGSYTSRMIYARFSEKSVEDGVYKTLLEGEDINNPFEVVESAIAFFPRGEIYPLIMTAMVKQDLKGYCHEILKIKTPEPDSDIKKTDNSNLYHIHIYNLDAQTLPQAMISFSNNSKGRKIVMHTIVGMSAKTALNYFKAYAKAITGAK